MSTTHSKTLDNGKVIDVFKLIKVLDSKPATTVPIRNIVQPSRSKKTGFSIKRYTSADETYPIIVDEKMNIIDGRHRYFRLLENNIDTVQVKVASQKDIKMCLVENESELISL